MFYERLYKSQLQPPEQSSYDPASTAEPVSLKELLDALKVMKRGRAKDEAGIVVEMLKDGSKCLLEAVLDMFNDVLSFRRQPPTEWKRTKLVVIFKKGVHHYRTTTGLLRYCSFCTSFLVMFCAAG